MKKIIGLRINKVNSSNYNLDLEYNDIIIDEYDFLYTENDKKYSVKYVIEQGMCGSGYCTADWIIEGDTKEVLEFGSIHYTPIGNCEISSFIGADNSHMEIYENGCSYYPSAYININFDKWRNTFRNKGEKQIYIFYGESAIGKSYLGSKFDSDIIIIGNKFTFDITQVKTNINLIDLVQAVAVGFKY